MCPSFRLAPGWKRTFRTALVVTLIALVQTPASARGDLVVFAAASLANALGEIEQGFEAATGQSMVVSLAGSSALARQIEQGAPADVFLSANSDWMDRLETLGHVDPASRFDLVGNRLVLIGHGGDGSAVRLEAGLDLPALIGERRLAMALVDAVPAGIYGKEALTRLGLWSSVAERVVQADNVRTALAFVARGEAGYGIVYASDAVAEPRVSVLATFPDSSHPPIVYPVAGLTRGAGDAQSAFLAYLRGPEARIAFERQGFIVFPRAD